ncbi:NRDE family protein [Candidatus Colwellia aromaticivorans]|uniref:NRDE family protein n=1 Tax=Candidatus Colwellia aromaticivorans TaxID=2267621 RepID=UPI001FE38B0D|nr:NRDE family protein [Candidatus Colwellia aromaticivorans]
MISNQKTPFLYMCILFFAIKQHPKYPVIICANRDEFHERPTQPMHWWPKNEVLAGKDLQAGGTWLGLNKQGRFSALTNFRQPDLIDNNKQSRGELVLQALAHQDDEMTKQLAKSFSEYNGFNLVFGQLNKLVCFDSVSQKKQVLNSGFHSLCNGALDDIWPKMALGQAKLADAIKDHTLDIDQLFKLMNSDQQAPTQHLPKTGIPLDWEQLLSSIFIVSPEYGTRTTNIITLDDEGTISIYDQSYNEQGECTKKQSFSIES